MNTPDKQHKSTASRRDSKAKPRVTMQVTADQHHRLRTLADKEQRTMLAIVDRALAMYERESRG